MCGHVGIAGHLEFKDEATMKRLLLIDYLRGQDSTGLAAIRKTNDVKIAKGAVNPIDLFDTGKFKEALSAYASKVFMGHNRAATKGAVNNVNAHPYQVDHIVGAHNGTLDAISYQELEDLLGEKFGTDSHAIIAGIAKFGVEELIPMLRSGAGSTGGAWSLVWFDLSANTLNFLRNDQRPMWLAYTDDFKKVMWASEWPMIDAATRLSGTGKDYSLYKDKNKYSFFSTQEDVWYRFDLDALIKGSDVVPKPKVKTLKGKEPAAATGYDPFKRYISAASTGQKHTTTTSTTTSRSSRHTLGIKPKKDVSVIHLFGNDEDPLAGLLTRKQFEEITKYGCSWCGESVEYTDQGVTIFERDQICLCPTCSGGENQPSRIHIPNFDHLL